MLWPQLGSLFRVFKSLGYLKVNGLIITVHLLGPPDPPGRVLALFMKCSSVFGEDVAVQGCNIGTISSKYIPLYTGPF